MEPILHPKAIAPLSGEFLEKSGLLEMALKRETELVKRIEPSPSAPDIISHTNETKYSSSPSFSSTTTTLISADVHNSKVNNSAFTNGIDKLFVEGPFLDPYLRGLSKLYEVCITCIGNCINVCTIFNT
jgi:hypothetical protein